MNGAVLARLTCHLPDQVLGNQELARLFPDLDPAKTTAKLGISERRIAASGETALDLACAAALALLAEPGVDRTAIDYLLFCTQSPDYFLPTGACILQDRLGLGTGIGAMDFNLGCSGYVYGLSLAKGLIAGGVARNVLLLTADTYSKYLAPDDRGNRCLFGDGASASLIIAAERQGIGHFVLGTDGRGAKNLIVANGGLRNRSGEPAGDHLAMCGPEIFNFTIESIPPVVERCLQSNGVTMETIDHVVFHQANAYILNHLRKKIGIPPEKFHVDMQDTGNTVSSTIPIVLDRARRSGRMTVGQSVLLVGFGVGYSWGATVITLT